MRIIRRFDGAYAFLSNFYPSTITIDGLTYPTVEHAFQAAKSAEVWRREEVRLAKTPGMAKRTGRALPLRADWEFVKIGVMRICLFEKFLDNPLRQMLLDTGDAVLVEGNTWHDNQWGECKCGRCTPPGRNLLGRLLTELRVSLQ